MSANPSALWLPDLGALGKLPEIASSVETFNAMAASGEEFVTSQRKLDPQDRLAQEVGRLTQELRQMRAQYLGEGAEPQAGCRLTTVSVGDFEALAEYEYQAGEAPNYDADSRGAGPGCPASVAVIQVLVNGRWIDPHDCFSDECVEGWEQRILEDLQ